MRRFQFRLDPALRLARFRLDQAQLELAAAQRTLADEMERRSQLLDQIRSHQARRADAQKRRLEIQLLLEAAEFENELFERLTDQEKRIQDAAATADLKTEAAHKCHAECEALERLRERRKSEHFQEALAAEQKTLDDHSVTRWRRV